MSVLSAQFDHPWGNSAKVMTDDRDDGCGRRGAFLMVPTGLLVVLLAVVGAYLWIKDGAQDEDAVETRPDTARGDLAQLDEEQGYEPGHRLEAVMHRGHGKHGPTHHSEKPR